MFEVSSHSESKLLPRPIRCNSISPIGVLDFHGTHIAEKPWRLRVAHSNFNVGRVIRCYILLPESFWTDIACSVLQLFDKTRACIGLNISLSWQPNIWWLLSLRYWRLFQISRKLDWTVWVKVEIELRVSPPYSVGPIMIDSEPLRYQISHLILKL